jgi:hypothetical protein
MSPNDEDWARSYSKQALSDLDTREILVSGFTFSKWLLKKPAKHILL